MHSIIITACTDTPAELEALHFFQASWHTPCAIVPRSAFERVGDLRADLIVLTVSDAESALAILRPLKEAGHQARLFAIVTTHAASDAVPRIARLVDDFVVMPVRSEEVATRCRRLVDEPAATSGSQAPAMAEALTDQLQQEFGLRNLVGKDPLFVQLVQRIPRIAGSDASVLITGETGTGKELFARAIHHLSPRREHPFVVVDCGAFPEQLLENELFGHVRGAFTGARVEHKGLARLADGGVLFLDEVDSLSLAAQSKLLRFLQERTFKPLGADRFRSANVRVLAATNGDLQALVERQRFRADLFFRLNIVPLQIMPLRKRPGDIQLLAQRFLEESCAERTTTKRLSAAALAAISSYRWPGNVRELYNLVQRAVVLTEGDEISAHDIFQTESVHGQAPPSAKSLSFREAKARAVAEFESSFIRTLLRRHNGNISSASREAGKDRRAFGRLVKKYGLQGLADGAAPLSE